MKDYYLILGVQPNASAAEIRSAYRDKLRFYHPDHWRDSPQMLQKAEEQAKEINEAYEILKDADRRASYDNERFAHSSDFGEDKEDEYWQQTEAGEKQSDNTYQQQQYSCPICNRVDMVKEVSLAHEDGDARLSPPKRPEPLQSMIWTTSPMHWFIGAFLPDIIVAFIIGVIFLMLSMADGKLGPMGPTNISILAVGVTFTVLELRRRYSRKAREAREAWDNTLRQWRKAQSRWEWLHYCLRDDTVFDPDTRTYVPAERVDELLYS